MRNKSIVSLDIMLSDFTGLTSEIKKNKSNTNNSELNFQTMQRANVFLVFKLHAKTLVYKTNHGVKGAFTPILNKNIKAQ